jgi:amidase
MKNLIFASAQELATSIHQRQVSALEVLEVYLAHIARHNPMLNAIVTLDEEGARRRAREADEALARGETWGPLHGVPVTVKDSLETAGLRTTSGLPSLANYVPSVDATVVMRLRAAGAIIVGKTNMPTLGMDIQTNNPVFGRTNNPWDLTRTPSGSSGGSAAAVAAGMISLELGSDWGGSLRTPAHYCGVYALKPTEHRVPMTGHIPPLPGGPRSLRHMAVIGPLARSIEDLALALRVISGPDGYDWEVPPVALELASDRSLDELRLAWTDDFDGVSVTDDTCTALATLAGELDKLGCRIEQRTPEGFDFTKAWELWGEMLQAENGSTLSPDAEAEEAARFGVAVDSEVPWLRGRARILNATMRQYTAILMERDALITALEQFFETVDALLCPVTVGPAFSHCPTDTPISVDGYEIPYWVAGGAYVIPFSLTGHPAVVLPLARSANGLPIGLQVVGQRWNEAQLLAIAGQLATVIGPFQQPPGYL